MIMLIIGPLQLVVITKIMLQKTLVKYIQENQSIKNGMDSKKGNQYEKPLGDFEEYERQFLNLGSRILVTFIDFTKFSAVQ